MKLFVTMVLLFAGSTSAGLANDAPPSPGEHSPSASAKSTGGGANVPAAKRGTGKPVKLDDNTCASCHTDADSVLFEGDKKRFCIPLPPLTTDVHWSNGIACQDCHGGNPNGEKAFEAHAKESGFVGAAGAERQNCATCHSEEKFQLDNSVHAHAGPADPTGAGTLLGCLKCHGGNPHHLLAVHDKQSPVFVDNQVKTCGACHEDHYQSYAASVHGQGLYKMGLAVTASCADCHGAHGIYWPADARSTINVANVATTCCKCHRFIEERLKRSVHGKNGLGQLAPRTAPGGRIEHTPTCTSCHQGHEILNPETAAFRLQLPSGCGNCHAQLSQQYALSMHGQLTQLGYAPAAECSDCHGAHEILPVADAHSTLSPENRRATCMKCHWYATANFLQFDPHADYLSAERNPLLHFVYTVLLTLLITTFVVFGLHSAIWLVRSVIDIYQHGRPQGIVPGQPGYQRFAPFHRIAHTILLIAFMGLAATGMPLKYSHHRWAKDVAFYLGGFESTSFWHRFFALVTFGCFIAYVVQLVRNYRRGRQRSVARWKLVFGPDSPVPNFRDLKDFARMLGWFAGLCRKPTFDRWAYWEKFDFWGALVDVMIIGSTGLVLWFPNFFCFFLPGDVLNIAKVIHSTQALLATGFVFAIHFFSVHLRAEKFPADLSMLTGFVSEQEMEEERPDWLERLRREGRLDELRATIPSRRRIWTNVALGYVALAGGMTILIGMVVAALGS